VAISHIKKRRRDSIRAEPELHQTRLFDTNLVPVPVTSAFPAGATQRPVTFMLDYEVTSASPSGIILNVGNVDPALTVFYVAGELRVTVGSGTNFQEVAQGSATRMHAGDPGDPNLIRLVVSVRPGDGSTRAWDQYSHVPLVSQESAGGTIPAWSDEDPGDLVTTFADTADVNGFVGSPGAPVGVSPVDPSRAFAHQIPHHYLNALDAPEITFDRFILDFTYHNVEIGRYPLLDDTSF
jgi:hypothetical protein